MPLNELRFVTAHIVIIIIVFCVLKYVVKLSTWMSAAYTLGAAVVIPVIVLALIVMKMNRDEEKQTGKE